MSVLSSALVKFTADISDVKSRMREAMGEILGVSEQMTATGERMGGVLSKYKKPNSGYLTIFYVA